MQLLFKMQNKQLTRTSISKIVVWYHDKVYRTYVLRKNAKAMMSTCFVLNKYKKKNKKNNVLVNHFVIVQTNNYLYFEKLLRQS